MLSVRQARALECLLTCPTKAEAARAAHIAPRTLRKYLSDPDFQQAYRDATAELVGDATRQMQQALSPAITTLRAIVENESEPTSSRISAARALLDFGLRYTELNDVLVELRRLEGGYR